MASNAARIYAVLSQPQAENALVQVLKAAGYQAEGARAGEELLQTFVSALPDLLILEETPARPDDMKFAEEALQRFPALPLLLLSSRQSEESLRAALEMGVCGWVKLPVRTEDFLKTVQNCLEKSRRRKDWTLLQARRTTTNLARRIGELETLARLAQNITSSLDLESVLAAVVSAAVELTGAEEGSLMLLDESSGELYVRAARNFNDEFVQTFRLPVSDSLAGAVLRSGQPVLLDENTPTRIATSYMVKSLAYVPLKLQERVFGVLGVDNRFARAALNTRDVKLLNALAEYTVIALENARLYTATIQEQSKLAAVLANVQDGVLVVDLEERLLLANTAARQALGLDEAAAGKPLVEILPHPELSCILQPENHNPQQWGEVELSEDLILSVQSAPIPKVGRVITLHDITHLRKMDRLKTDFVNSVSHDLRSPLTAILGYIDLVERVGPTNERQQDFIQRALASVKNLSSLVDDLLDLSRIEAGMDMHLVPLALQPLVRQVGETFAAHFSSKKLEWRLDLPQEEITLPGSPLQLRQLLDNLVTNAIKYTPEGGRVSVTVRVVEEQLLLSVSDTGQGIPPDEQADIFKKFFRASNVPPQVPGSGLGLSIVKSVVDNHQGRIWVESTPGAGSTFSVLLPLYPPGKKPPTNLLERES